MKELWQECRLVLGSFSLDSPDALPMYFRDNTKLYVVLVVKHRQHLFTFARTHGVEKASARVGGVLPLLLTQERGRAGASSRPF